MTEQNTQDTGQPAAVPDATPPHPDAAVATDQVDIERQPATPPPSLIQQDAPAGPPAGTYQSPVQAGQEHPGITPVGASNESPGLAPGTQAAAARAHALLTHIRKEIDGVLPMIERYIPSSVLTTAEAEVKAFIRRIL